MPYCRQCGTSVGSSDNFCAVCGSSLRSSSISSFKHGVPFTFNYESEPEITCDKCNGDGYIIKTNKGQAMLTVLTAGLSAIGMNKKVTCPKCNGSGKLKKNDD